MASEQARSSELSPAPGRLSSLVQKSWSFALEAPKLPTLILLFVVLVAVFAPLLAQHDPELSVKPIKIFSPPIYSSGEWKTPLGTDFQGRDILSRLIYGARTSLIIGLLGTVWGVMDVFSSAAQMGNASLTTVAPGVAAALATTVAGLLVAIPSMFGYNWLVHNLRVATVEMDNFAQELSAKIESEYLQEVPVNVREPRKAMESDPELKVDLKPEPKPVPMDQPAPNKADETRVDHHLEDDQPGLLPPDAEVQS